MTKTELKKNITKIKKFLKQRDYGNIDTGIELARGLDEPAVFEALLGGWSINDEGKLVLEEGYQGETLTKRWSAESWPYFAYALVNLIGYAPKNTKVDKSLEHSKLKTLDFKKYPWLELPSVLANLPNLTSLKLDGCHSLQNIDGLANLPNLTSLDLSWCDSLQNADVLANLPNLTSLDLNNCRSLQVPDDVRRNKIGRPISEKSNMTTRDEVVVYQDKIRIVMALKDGDMDVFSDYKATTILNLSGCTSLQNVDGLANLPNLTRLNLYYCRSLQNVDGLANLTKLTTLDLSNCRSLQNVDGLANLPNLTTLNLEDCESLQNVDGLANLPNLTTLNLEDCESLQNVDGLANLPNLTSLGLYGCESLQNVNVLANCTKLSSLDLGYCKSLQNVDGLANLPNLTSLDLGSCSSLQVPCEESIMTTRDEVVVYQDKIRIVMALKNGDMDVFPDYKATAILNLSGCTSLKNVDGLAKCTKLTSLDLQECESLQNVEPLIQLQELKVLSMEGCKKVKPLPRPMNMETRSEVESYFRRILKKAGRKIPDSLKSRTPKDLKSNLAKIKKLILKRDYDAINQGIELLRALDDPAVFESLLAGCSINENGKLMANRLFTGTAPAQPFLNYAVLNLIFYAPENTRLDGSLKRPNIKSLSFRPVKALTTAHLHLTNLTSLDTSVASSNDIEVLMNLNNLTSLRLFFLKGSASIGVQSRVNNLDGLGNLTNLTSLRLQAARYSRALNNIDALKNLTNLTNLTINEKYGYDVDILANLTNLTNLDLSYFHTLNNIDGLANLPNLNSLNLYECKSLQNVDGLANLLNLTTLVLYYCNSLQNVDGLANLTNLTSLDLHSCDSLQNVDGLATLPNLTTLNISSCKSLQNVDVLANLTKLTSLVLYNCDSLQNVDVLANLTNLTSLNLIGCDKVQPEPSKEKMTTRKQVAAYQEEIKKSMK